MTQTIGRSRKSKTRETERSKGARPGAGGKGCAQTEPGAIHGSENPLNHTTVVDTCALCIEGARHHE